MTTTKIPAEFLEAITGSEITDGGIGTADIADSGVTTAKIANNAITAAKLPDNVITATHIPDGLITGTHIAGTTITATQIANNAVGTDQLAGIARGKIIYGDSNGDPQLLTIGSNGTALVSDGTDISWGSAGETNRLPLAGGTMTGNIAHASDFTIDAGGDISLDADGEQIRFKDGGTEIGHIDMGSQNLTIRSKVSDKDIEFHGTDNGSNTVALTLDMSNAGYAYFNRGIDVAAADEKRLRFTDADGTFRGGIQAVEGGGQMIATTAQHDIAIRSQSNMLFSSGGNTERMRIASSGNVGIGTQSPSCPLEIVDSSASAPGTALKVYSAQNSAASDGLVFIHSDQELAPFTALNVRQDGTGDILNLLTDTTEVFTVTAAGTVGMGAGSGNFAGSLLINHDGTTGTLNNAYYNTGFGYEVFDKITSGDNNTAIGNQAAYDLNTGSANSLFGRSAGANINSGNYNTLGGYQAGDSVTDAIHNTAWGYEALGAQNGSYNTAIGDRALHANTAGNSNVAVGSAAMFGSSNSCEQNAAVGANAMEAITTGQGNAVLGHYAGYGLTSGNYNVAIGRRSLMGTCTGNFNIALGYEAMKGITSGGENVCIGRDAGHDITSANGNVAIGHESLMKNVSAAGNTMVGFQAGENCTGGSNTMIGYKAGEATEGGVYNVFIGQNTKGTHPSHSQQIAIGYNIDASPGQVAIGTSGMGKVYNEFNTDALWSQGSDERLKQDIKDSALGLDFINDLRPVTYKWKPSNELPKTFPMYQEENGRDIETIMTGLIAQEVKTAIDTSGVSRFGGWGEDNDGIQQIRAQAFVYPLIKAVQELKAELDAAKARIKTLEDA